MPDGRLLNPIIVQFGRSLSELPWAMQIPSYSLFPFICLSYLPTINTELRLLILGIPWDVHTYTKSQLANEFTGPGPNIICIMVIFGLCCNLRRTRI